MHRTEGLNNASNLFTNGPPGTRVEENILNAFQEEIANVIEGAGLTLQTAATDTRNQLASALATLYSRYYLTVDPTVSDQGAVTTEGNRSVKDHVDAIGTSQYATLIFEHNRLANITEYNFSTSEVIGNNFDLKIQNGARLKDDANNPDLTINGNIIAAPGQHIFDFENGTGSISFGSNSAIEKIYPNWWGFSPSASDAINSAALQAAINNDGQKISIPSGTYGFDTGVTVSTGDDVKIIQGSGWDTVLDYTGTGVAITTVVSDTTDKELRATEFRDFHLLGNSLATGGFFLGNQDGQWSSGGMHNVLVTAFTKVDGYCVRLGNVVEYKFENCNFSYSYYGLAALDGKIMTTVIASNCQFRTCDKYGVYLEVGNGYTFNENCVFESNDDSAMRIANTSDATQITDVRVIDCWFENNNITTDGYSLDIEGFTLANSPVVNIILLGNRFNGVATPQVAEGNGYLQYQKTHSLTAQNNEFSTDVDIGANKYVLAADNLYDNFIFNSPSATKYASGVPREQIKLIKFSVVDPTTPSNITGEMSSGYYGDSVPGDGVTIITIADWTSAYGGLVLVSGIDSTGNHRFQDTVSVGYDNNSVIDSLTVLGAPAARTYSHPTTTSFGMQLANDSKTYKIRAVQIVR